MWSGNRRPLARLLLCAGAIAGLSGCSDYLSRTDTVTLAAGDAQDWNRVVQTTDPWPPHARNTRIDVDGRRIAPAVQRYSTGGGGSTAGGAAPQR